MRECGKKLAVKIASHVYDIGTHKSQLRLAGSALHIDTESLHLHKLALCQLGNLYKYILA